MTSVNASARRLLDALIEKASALRVGVSQAANGTTLVDAGAAHPGGIEAGLRIAEICLGGLGNVQLSTDSALPRWPWTIAIASSQPIIACLASQYAGWSL